jgi:phage RecT family recombinase
MTRTQTRAKKKPAEQTTALVPFDAKEKSAKLVAAIEARRDQIASFLQARTPEEYDRFVNVAVDAIVRDNGLLGADLLSLVSSIRHAAIMGLEPTSVMGEGAIVVYRDRSQGGKSIAQFQPMVRGLQKLARNSGEIASIGVDVVRKKDHFEYRSGSDPIIDHVPFISGFTDDSTDGPGDVIGAYAFLKLRSGELVPLFMSTAEIHKRRAVSKQWQGQNQSTSIWATWPEEMMKKTVLRRLLQERAPLSFRAQAALALDAEIDSAEGDPEKVEARVSRTARRLLAHVDEPGTENGAGDEKKPEADSDKAPAEKEAQKPSGAAVSDPDTGEARVICGADGQTMGICIRGPHEKAILHRNEQGETWADE